VKLLRKRKKGTSPLKGGCWTSASKTEPGGGLEDFQVEPKGEPKGPARKKNGRGSKKIKIDEKNVLDKVE